MENKEERLVRHLGSRWSKVPDAGDDNKILRSLFRRGKSPEGKLAQNAGFDGCTKNPRFQASLKRLIDFGCVELLPSLHADAVLVRLTKLGSGFALDLCCDEQVVPPGSPADHVKMAAEKQ
ncbi:MAG TPA: hypothetical protein VKR59_04615 [Terriglobales bacterium]|nr:hypothetical protein [Terriglobales bacterium]